MYTFREKFEIFQNWGLKIAQKLPKFLNFGPGNVNFSPGNWKLKNLKKLSKMEFFALKNVEFCSKFANFSGKKFKFSKNLSKVLQTIQISEFKIFKKLEFSVENWKNFENLPFWVKKWKFISKICQKLQFWAWKISKFLHFFGRKSEKTISKKP